jgi:hypothetical protein
MEKIDFIREHGKVYTLNLNFNLKAHTIKGVTKFSGKILVDAENLGVLIFKSASQIIEKGENFISLNPNMFKKSNPMTKIVAEQKKEMISRLEELNYQKERIEESIFKFEYDLGRLDNKINIVKESKSELFAEYDESYLKMRDTRLKEAKDE